MHVERLLHGDRGDREAPQEGAALAKIIEDPAVRAPGDAGVIARDDGIGDDHRVVRTTTDPDGLAWLERERLASERDSEVAHSPAFLRGLPSNNERQRGGLPVALRSGETL